MKLIILVSKQRVGCNNSFTMMYDFFPYKILCLIEKYCHYHKLSRKFLLEKYSSIPSHTFKKKYFAFISNYFKKY